MLDFQTSTEVSCRFQDAGNCSKLVYRYCITVIFRYRYIQLTVLAQKVDKIPLRRSLKSYNMHPFNRIIPSFIFIVSKSISFYIQSMRVKHVKVVRKH